MSLSVPKLAVLGATSLALGITIGYLVGSRSRGGARRGSVALDQPSAEDYLMSNSKNANDSMDSIPQVGGIYHSSEGGILNEAMGAADARWHITGLSHPIHRICITGGPCSGKSSCMEILRRELTSMGFRVYVVPEVATLLIGGGLEFSDMTRDKRVNQQRVILQTIMMLEDAFFELATVNKEPCIILCDRGTMDGSAYCSEDEFQEILKKIGYTVAELRDARYNAVVHLVTTAIDAKEAYTTDNNAARRESPEEAITLDIRTRKQWVGHPMMTVVGNTSSFEKKIQSVIDYILPIVRSVPQAPPPEQGLSFIGNDGLEVERLQKIAVKSIADDSFLSTITPYDYLVLMITPTKEKKWEKIIRKRTGHHTVYFYAAAFINDEKVSREIQAQKFKELRENVPILMTMRKTQYPFLHNGVNFFFNKYREPEERLELRAPLQFPRENLPTAFEYFE